jgi:hypothetical protein
MKYETPLLTVLGSAVFLIKGNKEDGSNDSPSLDTTTAAYNADE